MRKSLYINPDQSSELGQALKKSQLELADAVSECQQMRVECESLQAQLEEASTAAETASILNSELEEKEAKVIQLSQEGNGDNDSESHHVGKSNS